MPSFLQNSTAVNPFASSVTILPADTTVPKAIVAAPGGPWHLEEILIASNDTAAQVVDVWHHSGATNFLLGSVNVPAGSGLAGLAPVPFVKNQIPDTLIGLDFQGQDGLFVSTEATVTTAKTVSLTAFFAVF